MQEEKQINIDYCECKLSEAYILHQKEILLIVKIMNEARHKHDQEEREKQCLSNELEDTCLKYLQVEASNAKHEYRVSLLEIKMKQKEDLFEEEYKQITIETDHLRKEIIFHQK